MDEEQIEVVIPASKATLFSFVFFLLALAFFCLPFGFLHGFGTLVIAWREFLTNLVTLLVALPAGMVVHELTHAAVWTVFAKHGYRAIRFGFDVRNLSPYVHCSDFLPVNHYAVGVIAPGLLLGVLPGLTSILIGNGWVNCFSVFFTAGAAGDFISLLRLRAFDAGDLVQDHRDHLGFNVRRKKSR
jgi:hypothetical protein